MSSFEILDLSMSNLDIILNLLVSIIAIITSVISFVVSKKHAYSRALLFFSIALFTIAIGWLLPIIPHLAFNFEAEPIAHGRALSIANQYATILTILGHTMLAIAILKFRNKQNDSV